MANAERIAAAATAFLFGIEELPMSAAQFLMVSACIAVSACSHSPAAPPAVSDKPTTLTIGFPFIDAVNGTQQAVRLLSFEGLVSIGRDGRPQARLAEGWTVSPDGLDWTIQLRHDAFFHDGSPVDSTAVKLSLERTLASRERDFSPGLLDIIDIATPTDDRVAIRLKTRSAFLLDDLVVSIVKAGPNKQTIGTGPYVISSTSPTEVVMDAYPSYYRGVASVKRIIWKSYPTARTSWAAMMRGEIDFLYEVAPEALTFMKDETSVEDFSFVRNYVHGIMFNSRRKLFADVRVKRALNYAIDRSAIIDRVFQGHGQPAYTPTWPQHWAYDSELPAYSYDPARATALLNAVGLTSNQSQDSARPPARFRFTCIFAENFPLWERMALIAQRNLSQIGVDLELESLPAEELNRRIGAGNFDAVLMDLVVGNATSRPYFFWYSTSKQNPWGYDDRLVDEALDHLRYAPDDDATRRAFRDLQAELLNDPPGVFLAFGETTRAVSRRFHPITPPGGDVFRTISEWRLADDTQGQSTN